MSVLKFTDTDRNANGRVRAPGFDDDTSDATVKAAPERSLADLLSPMQPAESAAPPVAPWSLRQIALAIGAGLLIVLALVVLISRAGALAPPRPLAATPAASATVPAPSPPAAPTPFGAALDVAMVAYFDPNDLTTATALEPGRRVEPVARIGHEWLQLELEDGALVWARWTDLPAPSASLDALPDLAPPPTAVPPPPASAPPVIQPAHSAPAAPGDCDPAVAPYVVHRQVEAFGSVDGCSYVSAEQAEQNADQLEAELRANAAATADARVTPTVPALDERGRQ
jgi:hypothetical protein